MGGGEGVHVMCLCAPASPSASFPTRLPHLNLAIRRIHVHVHQAAYHCRHLGRRRLQRGLPRGRPSGQRQRRHRHAAAGRGAAAIGRGAGSCSHDGGRRSQQDGGEAHVWGEEGGLNARAARGVWVGDCVCARWDKHGSETATSSASATLRSSSGAAAGGGTGAGRRRERAKRCAPLADNPQKGARAGGLSAVSTAPPWAAASLTQVTPTLARVDEEREKWRERRVTHLGRTRRAR